MGVCVVVVSSSSLLEEVVSVGEFVQIVARRFVGPYI